MTTIIAQLETWADDELIAAKNAIEAAWVSLEPQILAMQHRLEEGGGRRPAAAARSFPASIPASPPVPSSGTRPVEDAAA